MPKVLTTFSIHYEQQGDGEPLILIPYLAADGACYAFQVPDFAKSFTCYSVDLRGTGESEHVPGSYSTETLAGDVVGFMDAVGIRRAHIFGLSLGAGVGLWLGAKYPDRVSSLSLHGCWTKTDAFLQRVVESWQLLAQALGSVSATVIRGILPWCLTPETYAQRPDYIQALEDFVRSRPAQSLEAFQLQTDAVLHHDVEAQLSRITAPTQITVGQHDLLTSTRFIEPMTSATRDCEVHVFEGCGHAALYEHTAEFNATVVDFLRGRARARAA